MRGIKLTAAILTICIGGLMTISSLATLSLLATLEASIFNVEDRNLLDTYRITIIVILIFSITLVMFGGLFCRKTRDKGICITLLVLNSILAFLQLVGMGNLPKDMSINPMSVLLLIAMIAAVVLSIMYLVKLGKTSPLTKTSGDVFTQSLGGAWGANDELQVMQENIPNTKNSATPKIKTEDIEARIKMLKKLGDDGIITAEELREYIKKELDNM